MQDADGHFSCFTCCCKQCECILHLVTEVLQERRCGCGIRVQGPLRLSEIRSLVPEHPIRICDPIRVTEILPCHSDTSIRWNGDLDVPSGSVLSHQGRLWIGHETSDFNPVEQTGFASGLSALRGYQIPADPSAAFDVTLTTDRGLVRYVHERKAQGAVFIDVDYELAAADGSSVSTTNGSPLRNRFLFQQMDQGDWVTLRRLTPSDGTRLRVSSSIPVLFRPQSLYRLTLQNADAREGRLRVWSSSLLFSL